MKTLRSFSLIVLAVILLSSCEYKPFIECSINGTLVRIEGNGTVLAGYTNGISTVGGPGTSYDINIRFNGMIGGTYPCGSGGTGVIKVFNHTSNTTFSTEYSNGSGSINVVSAGSNLIEGYFSGTLKTSSGGDQVVITDGSFSGRAY